MTPRLLYEDHKQVKETSVSLEEETIQKEVYRMCDGNSVYDIKFSKL